MAVFCKECQQKVEECPHFVDSIASASVQAAAPKVRVVETVAHQGRTSSEFRCEGCSHEGPMEMLRGHRMIWKEYALRYLGEWRD
jgi:hypothetical protein